MHQFDNRYVFLIHCNVCSIAMYNIISINIGPILTFGTGPWILSMGEGGAELVEVDGMLQAKRSRSMACSGRCGRGRSDRAASTAKQSRRRRAPGAKQSRTRSIGNGML
jgi:hypothetical protein